jgi:carboxypeptidase PM20D1
MEQVRKTINNPAVKIAALPIRAEPSPVSDVTSAQFNLLQRSIREIMPEAIVAPSLLVAATDSRHYAPLSKQVYRFLPITVRGRPGAVSWHQ